MFRALVLFSRSSLERLFLEIRKKIQQKESISLSLSHETSRTITVWNRGVRSTSRIDPDGKRAKERGGQHREGEQQGEEGKRRRRELRRESRERKKQAARSSENDSIRSHINLLPADIPRPGPLRYQQRGLPFLFLLSFHRSTIRAPGPRRPRLPFCHLSLSLSFRRREREEEALLFFLSVCLVWREPREARRRSLGRGINYASCALAGIPRLVPVFAALLIRAPRPLPFRESLSLSFLFLFLFFWRGVCFFFFCFSPRDPSSSSRGVEREVFFFLYFPKISLWETFFIIIIIFFVNFIFFLRDSKIFRAILSRFEKAF